MWKHTATTPKAIHDAIVTFCNGIEPSSMPLYLNTGEEEVGHCFANVDAEAELRGGRPQFGWLIWELPHAYLTAEFHCVLNVDGTLIDPTAQMNGEKRILFLPSLGQWDAPRRVLNVYKPLTESTLLRRCCELQRRNQQIFYSNPAAFMWNPEFLGNDAESTRVLDIYFERRRQRQRVKRRK